MIPYIFVALGLLLIFLEFFLPGAILGISGGVLIILGVIFFAIQSTSATSVVIFTTLAIVLVIALIRLSIWALKRKGRGLYLNNDQEGYVASTFAKEYIGKTGKALTDLGPSGHVLVEGKRFQAVSQSGYLDKETEIIVTGGEGGHLLVRKKEVST